MLPAYGGIRITSTVSLTRRETFVSPVGKVSTREVEVFAERNETLAVLKKGLVFIRIHFVEGITIFR